MSELKEDKKKKTELKSSLLAKESMDTTVNADLNDTMTENSSKSDNRSKSTKITETTIIGKSRANTMDQALFKTFGKDIETNSKLYK